MRWEFFFPFSSGYLHTHKPDLMDKPRRTDENMQRKRGVVCLVASPITQWTASGHFSIHMICSISALSSTKNSVDNLLAYRFCATPDRQLDFRPNEWNCEKCSRMSRGAVAEEPQWCSDGSARTEHMHNNNYFSSGGFGVSSMPIEEANI